jgi:hypothetical protein
VTEGDGIDLPQDFTQSIPPLVPTRDCLLRFFFVTALMGKDDISEPNRYPGAPTHSFFTSYGLIVVPRGGSGHQVPVALRLPPRLEKSLPERNDSEPPLHEPGLDCPVGDHAAIFGIPPEMIEPWRQSQVVVVQFDASNRLANVTENSRPTEHGS